MSEKRFKNGDNLSCVDTETGKSYWYACNLCGLLNEQQATITNLQGDVERLKYIIEELRKDNYNKFELINKMKKEEKLYAKEILRLNELDKQKNQLNDILGGY